jgi:predicted aspartyl protease
MKVQALTLTAPRIAQSIRFPVVISQSNALCQRFALEQIEVDVYALLDTGATNTAISESLAKNLGLKPIGRCKVGAAGGARITAAYSIDVTLRSLVRFINVHASAFVGSDQFDIIIGMDILTQGDLAITNGGGRTVMSFRVPPDVKHIDYVKITEQND